MNGINASSRTESQYGIPSCGMPFIAVALGRDVEILKLFHCVPVTSSRLGVETAKRRVSAYLQAGLMRTRTVARCERSLYVAIDV